MLSHLRLRFAWLCNAVRIIVQRCFDKGGDILEKLGIVDDAVVDILQQILLSKAEGFV